MNFEAMNLFLSEENIKRHLEHLREKRLCYSILEKSIPALCNVSMNEILRLNIDRQTKNEALSLLWYIKSHECFFDSFSTKQSLKNVSSICAEKLLYEIYTEAMKKDQGFLFVLLDKQGSPRITFSNGNDGSFIKYAPLLALDLYEHTYFLDYGFDKKRFLQNAISHLNISSLDKRG